MIKAKRTPSFVRISHELTVPMNVIFEKFGEAYRVVIPGGDKLLVVADLQGQVAEAVTAFLSGSVQFPVTSNGIIDLPAGWTARRQAKETLSSLPSGNAAADGTFGSTVKKVEYSPVQPPSSSPTIDMNRVLEAKKRLLEANK